MKWFHEVSPDWLQARKNYLSASDIKKLIPVTPTGRPRANLEDYYLKAWAEKQTRVTEDDVCSSGAMARGHLLEPYAIDSFNRMGVFPTLHHWDDTLIHSADGMSYSPDALSTPQPVGCAVDLSGTDAKHLGEVKAYKADMHYAVGLAPSKMLLEERWQLASAFYCSPELETAALILFNPRAKHPILFHHYNRADLDDEVDMIGDVVVRYVEYAADFMKEAITVCPESTAILCPLEENIIIEMEEEQAVNAGLNP